MTSRRPQQTEALPRRVLAVDYQMGGGQPSGAEQIGRLTLGRAERANRQNPWKLGRSVDFDGWQAVDQPPFRCEVRFPPYPLVLRPVLAILDQLTPADTSEKRSKL